MMRTILLILCFFISQSSFSEDRVTVEALTAPCKDITLSFIYTGEVANIYVKEGDRVELGAPLVVQDSRVIKLKITQLELERARAAARLVFIKKAALENAVSFLELKKAEVDAKIAKIKLEQEKIKISKMTLKSPFSGIVEKVIGKKGEIVNKDDDIIRVVKINPLWVEAPVPLKLAKKLKVGGVKKIEFDGKQGGIRLGKIIYIGNIADAGSETLTVRFEVPNNALSPAGEHVRILLKP